jgi:transmembrane sensor
MMAAPRSHAERAAIGWEVRLRDPGASERELRAFRAWHDGAPEHAAAWASLQGRLAQMGGRASHAGGGGLAVARALRQPVEERRRALRTGFGVAMLALSGAGSWQLVHELGYDATWRSAVGERGEATLADGSALRFDAASRIDLADGPGAARLHLRQGQLLVWARGRVSVAVAGAEVGCEGAELCVGLVGRRGIAAVRGGGALLRLPGRTPVTLASGDTWTFDGAAGGAAVPSPLSFNAAAGWTRGMLVADRLPLPDLAEAFGRYHRGILRVGGAAGSRVISGVFRLGDLEGALRQIAGALPVQVARYGMLTIVE